MNDYAVEYGIRVSPLSSFRNVKIEVEKKGGKRNIILKTVGMGPRLVAAHVGSKVKYDLPIL